MGSYSAMYPVVSCPVSSVVITQPLTTTTIRSNTLEALVHNPPKETAIRLEPKVLHNCQHIKHTCRKVRILRYEMFYIYETFLVILPHYVLAVMMWSMQTFRR